VPWAHTTIKTLAADAAFDCLDEAVSVRFFHSGVLFSSSHFYTLLSGRELL
jgi:hypothetical protein